MIGYGEAYALTLDSIRPLDAENIALARAEGRVAAGDLLAQVDSPSLDVSLKDGYAVHGADVCSASLDFPVYLKLVGSVAAGGDWRGQLLTGEAVRILSGARLPQGADAVVSEEFTEALPGEVRVTNHAEPGRNILPRGCDVQLGQLMVPAGRQLYPTTIGLLAAAGYSTVPVVRSPRVAVLATGDELVAPGQPLIEGKLFASNLFTLAAGCQHYGFEVETYMAQDDASSIRTALAACLEKFDAVITSGGAWKGEHDLTVHVLDDLGWQKIYHRVRIGPGKAVGFGLVQSRPVFCLPGGPPSNHMAFLQLALPGLQKLAGFSNPGLHLVPAVMTETVSGQIDWTQFIHGRLERDDNRILFTPLKQPSRLHKLAQTEAVAIIPEGVTELPANGTVMVQVLD